MNANTRSLASLGVMVVFGSLLVATSKARTDDNPRPKPTATAEATGAGPTAWPAVTQPNLDTASLATRGSCATKPTHGFCRLLAEFEGAEAWTDVPSAQTFFYGESVGLGGDADNRREPFYASAGGSPLMAGARSLVPENPKEQADATKLLGAVKVGGPAGNSEAAQYIRSTPMTSSKLDKTMGLSHRFSRPPVTTYFRKKGSRVLVIEWGGGTPIGHTAKARSSNAIAYAAELWKLN